MALPIITLLSDFGAGDAFGAMLQGALYSLLPEIRLVNAADDLPRHDIFAAGFALLRFHSYYPPGTIHLAGVEVEGAGGRALVASAGGQYFLGADNGILGLVLERHPGAEVLAFAVPTPTTFLARDVLAPAAARLAQGVRPQALGAPCHDWARLELPRPLTTEHEVQGEVLHVDAFGNLMVNFLRADAPGFGPGVARGWKLWVEEVEIGHFQDGYAPAQAAVAGWGAEGWLEISVPGGSAAQRLHAQRGTKVLLRRAPTPVFR